MEKTKPHIARAAQRMLERFGDAALHEIDLRIRELQQRGEKNAAGLWQDVRKAVQDLYGEGADNTKH
jgi:hypothetical protein